MPLPLAARGGWASRGVATFVSDFSARSAPTPTHDRSGEELAGVDPQGGCERNDDGDPRFAFGSLDEADFGAVQPGCMCQLFLGEPSPLA